MLYEIFSLNNSQPSARMYKLNLYVQVEPILQPVDGEIFERRTSNSANWGECKTRYSGKRLFQSSSTRFFFDIKMLNPNSASYLDIATKKVYENAERAKRALYNDRILHVERGTFAPLIFSVTGGTGQEARTFLRLLCEKISYKNRQDYSCVSNFIKCKLSFLIRKLVLLCVRGTRVSKKGDNELLENDFEFGCFESKLRVF